MTQNHEVLGPWVKQYSSTKQTHRHTRAYTYINVSCIYKKIMADYDIVMKSFGSPQLKYKLGKKGGMQYSTFPTLSTTLIKSKKTIKKGGTNERR